MRFRQLRDFRPRLERLEARRPLTAGASASLTADATVDRSGSASTTDPAGNTGPLADNQDGLAARGGDAMLAPGLTKVQLDRVTNPKGQNAQFHPPFGHVLVQTPTPISGQVYNILFISVYNGTARTFAASDHITVRTSNTPPGQTFPILAGDQQWKPGGRIVFYVFSKKYYPFTPAVSSGFQFNFVSPKATAIPGPSGIALRVKYNPATFDQILDRDVTSGPGAIGHQFGLPDTALWEIFPPSARIIHL